MTIPCARRFTIALTAVICAGLLFRANIASALVTRGDDGLRTGRVDQAISHYRRAIQFDPRSSVALDRFAFALLTRRAPGDAALALVAVEEGLRRTPADPAFLADHAFAARQLGRWRLAERDFAAAARRAHDPRYAHFAARMAQRVGDRAAERNHLHEALAIDSTYAPARILLARVGR